jgi:hypothetical protein
LKILQHEGWLNYKNKIYISQLQISVFWLDTVLRLIVRMECVLLIKQNTSISTQQIVLYHYIRNTRVYTQHTVDLEPQKCGRSNQHLHVTRRHNEL